MFEVASTHQNQFKFSFPVKPDLKQPFLYLGVSSKHTQVPLAHQPISIKAIYGEITIPRVGTKKLKQPKDLFQRVELKLFGNMSEEERREDILEIKKRKQRAIFELAHGKNFIDINRSQAYLLRMTGMKRKYQQQIVAELHQANFEQMRQKAKAERLKQAEENAYKRDFLTDQADLRRRMKIALMSAFREESVLENFYQFWVTSLFLNQIFSSTLEHIAQRRQRTEDIETVGFGDRDVVSLRDFRPKQQKRRREKRSLLRRAKYGAVLFVGFGQQLHLAVQQAANDRRARQGSRRARPRIAEDGREGPAEDQV